MAARGPGTAADGSADARAAEGNPRRRKQGSADDGAPRFRPALRRLKVLLGSDELQMVPNPPNTTPMRIRAGEDGVQGEPAEQEREPGESAEDAPPALGHPRILNRQAFACDAASWKEELERGTGAVPFDVAAGARLPRRVHDNSHARYNASMRCIATVPLLIVLALAPGCTGGYGDPSAAEGNDAYVHTRLKREPDRSRDLENEAENNR
jgi:hypothetical protein